MGTRVMLGRGCLLAVLALTRGVWAAESKKDMPPTKGEDSVSGGGMPAWMEVLPEQKELPDPFLKPDGKRVRTAEEWDTQRKYLKGLLLKYKHGEVPEDSTLAVSGKVEGNATTQTNGIERIDAVLTVKTRWKEASAAGDAQTAPERTLQFNIHIFRPVTEGKSVPVIVCPLWVLDKHMPDITQAIARGYAYVLFDGWFRTRNAAGGGLFSFYPGQDFGELTAWAWGYSRTIDYLLTLPFIDSKRIAVAGFSKTGVCSLLAGVLDERIALVMTGGSNVNGTQVIRLGLEGEEIIRVPKEFPYWNWLGERYRTFWGHETRLPVDSHTAVALCAPRALVMCDGLNDNYVDSRAQQQSYLAALEVYRFLGVPDKLGSSFHGGGHGGPIVFERWLEFADGLFKGEPRKTDFRQVPHPELKRNFSWQAPATDHHDAGGK